MSFDILGARRAMKKNASYCAVAVLLVCITMGRDSRAAGFRVSLDTSLFHFQRDTYDSDGERGDGSISSFGFGDGGFLLDYELVQPTIGFRLGLGLVFFRALTVGMMLALNGGSAILREDSNETDEMRYTLFTYEFLPFISYKFNIGKVQPFLVALLGYNGSVFTLEEEPGATRLTHYFAFGGGGGLHIFPAKYISFDITILAKGRIGRYIYKYKTPEPIPTEKKVKYPLHGIKLNLLLGLSGWF
jgi:hypothetical protein